jgi:hypothetical protein
MYGKIDMFLQSGSWVVGLPDNTFLSSVNSATMGLQEALNWQQQNGYCFECWGSSEIGDVDPGQIVLQQTLQIPSMAKGSIRFHATSLLYNGPFDCDAVDIGNRDMGEIDIGGQIIYPGNASAVGIYGGGSYNEGTTTFSVFTSSRIKFLSIACVNPYAAGNPASLQPQNTHGTGLSVNPNGPIMFTTIDVNEINGGLVPWVVYSGANQPGPTTGLKVNVANVH